MSSHTPLFTLIGLITITACQAFPAPLPSAPLALAHPPTRRQEAESSSSVSPSSSSGTGTPISGLTIVVPLAFLVGAGVIGAVLFFFWHRKHRNDPRPAPRAPPVRPRQYLSRQESGASVRSLPKYSIQAGDQELVLARQSSNLAEELYRRNQAVATAGPSEQRDTSAPAPGIIGALVRSMTSSSLRGPAPSYLDATTSRQSSDVEAGPVESASTPQNQANAAPSRFRKLLSVTGLSRTQSSRPSTTTPEMVQVSFPAQPSTSRNTTQSQPRNSSQSFLLHPVDSRHSTESAGSNGRTSTDRRMSTTSHSRSDPPFRSSYDAPLGGFTPDQMRFLSEHEGVDLARVHIGPTGCERSSGTVPPPRFEEATLSRPGSIDSVLVSAEGSRGREMGSGSDGSSTGGSPVRPPRAILSRVPVPRQ